MPWWAAPAAPEVGAPEGRFGRRPRWARWTTLLTAALLIGEAACGGAPGTADSSTITVLDPTGDWLFHPTWDMPAKFLLFQPLVRLDERGEFEPALARRWEHSADFREWTYHLRTDVRWHDGVPVTARDIEFTIGFLSHPAILYYTDIERVVVPNDSTVVVRSKRPFEGRDWWTTYYPRHLLDTLDVEQAAEWPFWERPVGNGPYRFVRHVPETLFELAANPDYFRGKPRIERLLIKLRGAATVMELQSGQVDASMYVTPGDIPKLRADPRLSIYHEILPDVGWLEGIFWNHRHPALGDARVRRALTMAIDRAELRKLEHKPDGLPIFDVLFTGAQFWSGDLPDPLPYDPVAASRLLAEAGWRDLNGDGILEKGRPLRFTALVPSGGPTQTHGWGQAAVYAQAAFRRIGVDMQIETIAAGMIARLRAGEFEAAFYRFFQPNASREFGFVGYGDSTLRAQVRAAKLEMDSLTRDRLHRALMPRLARDLPITFLAPQVQFFVANRKIRGLSSPFRAQPLMHLEYASIEDDRDGTSGPGSSGSGRATR